MLPPFALLLVVQQVPLCVEKVEFEACVVVGEEGVLGVGEEVLCVGLGGGGGDDVP